MQTNKFSAAVGLKPTPPGNNSTDPRDRHACGHLKGRGGLPHGGVVAISVGSLGARLAVARSTATAASQSTTHQSAAHYSWRQRLTSCLAAARSWRRHLDRRRLTRRHLAGSLGGDSIVQRWRCLTRRRFHQCTTASSRPARRCLYRQRLARRRRLDQWRLTWRPLARQQLARLQLEPAAVSSS